MIRCQICGADNPGSNKYCRQCGSPLQADDTSIPKAEEQKTIVCFDAGSYVPQAEYLRCGDSQNNLHGHSDDISADIQQPELKNRISKWVLVLGLAALLGIGFGFMISRMIAGSEEVKTADLVSEGKSQNIKTESEAPESAVNEGEKTDGKESGSSSSKPEGIILNVTPVTKDAATFSGPACIHMLLGAFDVFISQPDISKGIQMDTVGRADYRIMTDYINEQLAGKGISDYTGNYMDAAEMTDRIWNEFLSVLDSDLEEGKPVILVIGSSAYPVLDADSNAVIYGKSEDGYELAVPGKSALQTVTVAADQLRSQAGEPGFYCWIA